MVSIKILCMQIEGLIPFMSYMDQENASKFFLRTSNSLVSISLSSSEEIIIGIVSSFPKNAYLRPFGNYFSTNPSRVFFSSSKIDYSSLSSRASIVSINSRIDDRSSQSNSAVVSDFVKHCSSGLLFPKSYSKLSCEGIKVSILM